jgi:hypothetical protein
LRDSDDKIYKITSEWFFNSTILFLHLPS